jgi:hypothetical protein
MSNKKLGRKRPIVDDRDEDLLPESEGEQPEAQPEEPPPEPAE